MEQPAASIAAGMLRQGETDRALWVPVSSDVIMTEISRHTRDNRFDIRRYGKMWEVTHRWSTIRGSTSKRCLLRILLKVVGSGKPPTA